MVVGVVLTLFVFIDRDLYKLMEENFPEDTEENIIQVVLAMINAVQLLYNDDSLDVDIQFMIKRLEILQTDPPKLERSYNIDRYLASFCKVNSSEIHNPLLLAVISGRQQRTSSPSLTSCTGTTQ